ncbi:MAG: hypothetical protein ACTSUR_02885 [Candidatus Heimdallarchaeaceae archaeon]
MPWYPVIKTYNEKASKIIVQALKMLGFNADYQTSKNEKAVYIRDVYPELAQRLAFYLKKLIERKLLIIVVQDGKKYIEALASPYEIAENLPTREELLREILLGK